MYGLKYTIPYRSISDIPCEIRIEVKDYTGQAVELKGGEIPLSIQTDESDLLTPIRSSGATLSVYGSDYLQDLYTNDPFGVKVTQLVDSEVHWIGYILHDTFSQDFTNPEFIFEVECVAALSVLKYKKFDLTSDFVTFAQIVTKAKEYSGYSDVVYTNSVRLKTGSYFSARIPSSNFYDELGEAMNYYEVLEEIAKYGGCTFIPFKNILYFLDIKAIGLGYTSHTKLSGGTINLSDLKTVTNYKGTGTKISRIAGKNKAVVNCSLYEVEKNVIEFDDKKSVFKYPLTESVRLERKNSSGGKDFGDRHFLIRMFDQPKYTFHRYWTVGGALTLKETTNKVLNLTEVGSGFARRATYDTWYDTPPPSRLDFTNEIVVRSFETTGTNGSLIMNRNHPVVTIKSDRKILSAPNNYFALSFNLMAQLNDWYYNDNISYSADVDVLVYVSLSIGNLFYNGTSWTSTQSKFPVKVDINGRLLGAWHSVKNINPFEQGMPDVSGRLIPTPSSIVSGNVELTIYHEDAINAYVNGLSMGTRWVRFMYYKDIVLTYAIPDEQAIYGDWVDEDSKNDVIYENVIDSSYVEEADEIDLKICTNTDGKIALSSVLEGNDFLTEIETDAFGTKQPEQILLDRVIDLYDQPRFVIDPVLSNNATPWTVFTEPHLNKRFIYAGGEEDVKMERTRYNLIEI